MNDNLIIQLFITDKNKINSHYKQIINKDQEIKEYLDNRYKDGNNDYCDIYNIKKYCCYYKNIDSYENFVIKKDDTALAKKNDKFVVRCYNSGITEYKVKLL